MLEIAEDLQARLEIVGDCWKPAGDLLAKLELLRLLEIAGDLQAGLELMGIAGNCRRLLKIAGDLQAELETARDC